jgi:hypothetical protein
MGASLFCLPVMAEDNNEIDAIRQLMFKLGLENIEVSKTVEEGNESDPLYKISYENRTFLHEIKALGQLLSSLKEIIQLNSSLEIFPQSNGKVISLISLNYQDYQDFKNSEITEEEFAKKVNVILNPGYHFTGERANPLLFHTDLALTPSYTINAQDGPIILFSPTLTTYFDNGWNFGTRFRVPVYSIVNGFDYQKNFQLFTPGFNRINIDYSAPVLDLPLYTTFRLAHIYENQEQSNSLVLSNELQYFINGGQFNINLSSGINYNLGAGSFDFSVLPSGQFYLGKLDVVLEGGAGKFLNNTYGFWGRITRQFDNVDIGFSLYRTFGSVNSAWRMNFEYNIAIGPEHGIDASVFRVTYPQYFAGLLLAGNGVANQVSVYKTQDFIKRLYPEYLKTHLYYWRE